MFGYDLTPGMVSSIIAAGILIIQYTLPLFLGIVLAGLIQNASTANTWSVITTLLHNSNLHTLLFSDSASTTHIARPVLFLSYVGLLSLGLIALSGVLTPLGIRDGIAGRDVPDLRFELALDNGSFFLGTAERTFYALTRVCGSGEEACPGQEGQTMPTPSRRRLTRRATAKKYRIGSSVPAPLTSLFTKSAAFYGASVASVFDIQFRNYIILNAAQHTLANGLRYTIGQFRFLETLILSRGYKLIDGLIVDTSDGGGGGVGFRKHAVPDREKKKNGASWAETLLWMAPETACVANNVSLQVTTDDDGGAVSVLVDTGGFRGLGEEPGVVADVAGVPDLAARAWRGAYYFNKDVAAAVGAGEQAGDKTDFEIEGDSVWIGKLQVVSGSLGDSQFVVHRVALGAQIVDGTQNGTSIDSHCAGLTTTTPSGAPLVTCGLIIGAPRRNDTESSNLAGTYRYPLYTCATAIRATLRTTHFTSNGTARDLASLTIHNATLPPSAPLWAIESHPNLTAAQISPLWGPLHPNDADTDGIATTRAHALYLPAGQGGGGIADSLAGTGAYQYAAGLMYETSLLTPDYSGKTNYALYRQWERVTADAGSVAELPGLVWTDVFANLVTSVAAGGRGVGVVRVYDRVLWYDVRYAVPVGLLVALWCGVWGVAMVFWLGRRVRVKELRQLLNQVSTGRVVVNMLEGSKEGGLSAGRWGKGRGRTVVGLECRGADGGVGWEREGGYEMVGVGGMAVGFVEAPKEGRVLELLKRKN
ncbi:hypothetical protein DFP73DRAFT_518481 [Morchella snyderi]|nr:hypothetical protein DFP73DRAFT_518481 [Morchella snyderi]